MARLRVQEALAERWEEAQERLTAAYGRFRESRLYVQTVCTAVLVGAAVFTHLLPAGPLARLDAAVEWVVTQDYDFRGRAVTVSGWVRDRGGWRPAMANLWQQGSNRVRAWIGPVGPFAAPKRTTPDSVVGSANTATPPPGQSAVQKETATALPITASPLQPVEGSVLWDYGWLPQGVGEEFHEGIDFLARAGAPVIAVLDGTVSAIRLDRRLGTVVVVTHGEIMAVYAQVEAVAVRAGDEVKRGQPLGAVARSKGMEQSMPPHLHFEVRPVETGEPVDPASYLGLGGKKL